MCWHEQSAFFFLQLAMLAQYIAALCLTHCTTDTCTSYWVVYVFSQCFTLSIGGGFVLCLVSSLRFAPSPFWKVPALELLASLVLLVTMAAGRLDTQQFFLDAAVVGFGFGVLKLGACVLGSHALEMEDETDDQFWGLQFTPQQNADKQAESV